jgi:hypothetical protein
MANSGLGTSGQNFQAGGTSNQASQTQPWGPAQAPEIMGLNNITNLLNAGGFYPNQGENGDFAQASQNLSQIPNFGPAAAQTAANYLQTGGDPTGLLRAESQNIGIGNPQNTPGMQQVLSTIQNDISNQVNSQFAGAGRSLSGLNEQTLARGLAQGEAVPLLNQYNQNIANQMGIAGAASGNIQTGLQDASAAPGLATAVPLADEQIQQQAQQLPISLLGQYENLINPTAGLGGSSVGSQITNQTGSGTATNSLLSQLGQVGGLINPFSGLLGTLFG